MSTLSEIIGRGRGRAGAVQLLNDTISARQALDRGIAYRFTVREHLDTTPDEICARIMDKKNGSIQMTKQLLRRAHIGNSLNDERKVFVQKITGREASDGLDDFVTRRD